VLPEPPVLDGHDRLLHHGRDVLRRDDDPVLVSSEDGQERLAVRGVDVAQLLHALALDPRFERGKVAGNGAHEPVCERDETDEAEGREDGEEAELANPTPLGRFTASSEKHEAPDSIAARRLLLRGVRGS